MSRTDRVAVVVVHGVADQRRGQTAREVARLMCHALDGPPPYAQGEIHEVLVPVETLTASKARKPQATRRRPGTPSGFYQALRPEVAGTSAAGAQTHDLGIALSDYLLDRSVLPERDTLYEATRVSLRRRADDRTVHLYEMYWADLSRLGAGGLRALSSLYQLFFHLNTLAADVIDQIALGANGGRAWRLLQRLHAWMAWLMKGPTALLQLAMLLMVGFGVAALVTSALRVQLIAAAFGLGALLLMAFSALAWLRGTPGAARWAKLLFLLAAALVSLAATVFALLSDFPVHRMYFGVSALAVALLGGYLVERYSGVTPGVRLLGHSIVAATIVMLCVYGKLLLPSVSTQGEWMITAALNVGEWLLAAVLLAWAVFVAVQIVALVLGWWLGRGCDQAARASLHTSRLALIGSSGLFAVLSLVLWSVIGFVAGRSVPKDVFYLPIVFRGTYRSVEIFLEDRVQTLGGFFTPLVLAFALLAAAVVLVLLPSLIEEIRPTTNVDAQGASKRALRLAPRLGNWLSGGLRLLGDAFQSLVPLGAIAGSFVYLAFVAQQFAFRTGLEADVIARLAGLLEPFRGDTLVAAGKWLAGGAVTIAALGSRFTQTFGRLRVALDAVLDIDNYFADPPNGQPPRARIYSRFASLLAYLREAGYARIVIVAHSQGTVISADLLRYLHKQGRLRSLIGALPVSLVTVGSPLRDLYAERFPLLYRWMGSRERGFANAAPAAAELGVSEWVNACRSGDYVGRFIWTPEKDPAHFGVALIGADGSVDARRAGGRTEFCLGAGGHTHYFSNDAVALAVEIDRLIVGADANL